MSTIRLVYQNHLLPPVLKPYKNLKDYFSKKVFKDADEHQRKNFWSLITEDEEKKIKKEMKDDNQVILEKLNAYSHKYIQPLKECPTFESILLQHQIKKYPEYLSKSKKEIVKAISESSFMDRSKAHHQYNRKYSKFTKDLSIKSQVIRLPVLIYEGPKDFHEAQKAQIQWSSLSQPQKEGFQYKYVNMMNDYKIQLTKIALMANIDLKELLKLMNEQYQLKDDAFSRYVFR